MAISGYMSPEYAMHGHFSIKSDMYSFGVLVLEIICGKNNSSFYQTDGADDLVSYVSRIAVFPCIIANIISDLVVPPSN